MFLLCLSAWAWVGYGHSDNLVKTDELIRKEGDPHRIIVSRSHAGAVNEVANLAFNKNVKVTPAGGAGKSVQYSPFILLCLGSLRSMDTPPCF